mmetsp:Transcript_19143/g.49024  ORF Transcript_19143/g.49024 Transcript_19143/m.49024 type:complete len:127 (-) Transcript_19143:98-478(-)
MTKYRQAASSNCSGGGMRVTCMHAFVFVFVLLPFFSLFFSVVCSPSLPHCTLSRYSGRVVAGWRDPLFVSSPPFFAHLLPAPSPALLHAHAHTHPHANTTTTTPASAGLGEGKGGEHGEDDGNGHE